MSSARLDRYAWQAVVVMALAGIALVVSIGMHQDGPLAVLFALVAAVAMISAPMLAASAAAARSAERLHALQLPHVYR